MLCPAPECNWKLNIPECVGEFFGMMLVKGTPEEKVYIIPIFMWHCEKKWFVERKEALKTMDPKNYTIVRNSVRRTLPNSILKHYQVAHLEPPVEMPNGLQKNLELLKAAQENKVKKARDKATAEFLKNKKFIDKQTI